MTSECVNSLSSEGNAIKCPRTELSGRAVATHFLMFVGSNLDDLPPPEHVWDLLAAAGGSPMVQSVIFDGFWLPS